MISAELREQVRQRANCACEFCGVSETDIGAKLTIDHFQPQSREGADTLNNLVYACVSCNQYKQDYWATDESSPRLWNPREETFSAHFIELEDGQLFTLTETGEFTCKRLRLNRPPLVAHRSMRHRKIEETRLLERYRNLVILLTQSNDQLADLVAEQQELLREQRNLLQALLRKQDQR
ncbi:HNH endonuclease [Leptolyngbya sp. AN03gr2]|uniref:HNH endonuclease n=1 Tax=unclassified Leptolyngbya TaxID=2650499 RepID=UPI003D324347